MKSLELSILVIGLALSAVACEPEYSGLDFELVNETHAFDVELSDDLIQVFAGTAAVAKVTPRSESQHGGMVTLIAEDEDILRIERGRDDAEFVLIGNAPGITEVIVLIDHEEMGVIDVIILPWDE